jgi:hypothetical protein
MTSYYAHSENQHPDKAVEDKEINVTETDKSMANPAPIEKKPRTPGSLKGQIFVADDFDAPMSEEELALWYDAPIFPVDE